MNFLFVARSRMLGSFLSLALVLSGSAHADTFYSWVEKTGTHHNLHVREGKSALGSAEVRVTLSYDFAPGVIDRTAWSGLEPLVLVGRDTNSDGNPDTWFVINNDGIQSVRFRESLSPSGTDVLAGFLADGLAADLKQTIRQVYRKTAGALLLAISLAEQDYDRYLDLQMSLLESEMRVDRLIESHSLSAQDASLAYAKIKNEWTMNRERFVKMSRGSLFWTNGLVDVGSFFALSYGMKLLNKLAETTLGSFLISQRFETVSAGIQKITGRFEKVVAGSLERLNLKRAALLAEPSRVVNQARLAAVPATKGLVNGVIQGVRQDLLYISLTQTIQVIVETSARWNQFNDPNPIKRAGQIFTDKDFLQNFLYMSNETLLTNGLLNHMQARSFVSKMFAMGVVSFIDSNIMSFCIKDGVDPARATFDTAWEIIPGNGQTMVDNYTRRKFSELAQAKGNPKLAWFGIGVNLLDQAMGYYLYNAASSFFEKNPHAFNQFMSDLARLEKREQAKSRSWAASRPVSGPQGSRASSLSN